LLIADRGGSSNIPAMSEVTRILAAVEAGDAKAAEELLPLVYDELRRMAAAQMAREKPGQTLDATALVHELPEAGSNQIICGKKWRRDLNRANNHLINSCGNRRHPHHN
jgi:hypothetical protein